MIGKGHFGDVILVHERPTNDVYAMKKIRKSDCLKHKDVSMNMLLFKLML